MLSVQQYANENYFLFNEILRHDFQKNFNAKILTKFGHSLRSLPLYPRVYVNENSKNTISP